MVGIHLPFIKTMLAVTLIVGILPVVGNLISNTVIVLVSARAWEMLLAMLVMEAAFGVPGIAVAPVYYAYMRGRAIAILPQRTRSVAPGRPQSRETRQKIPPLALRQSAISAMIHLHGDPGYFPPHPSSFVIGSMRPGCRHPDLMPGKPCRVPA
jgi:hypothetical protein